MEETRDPGFLAAAILNAAQSVGVPLSLAEALAMAEFIADQKVIEVHWSTPQMGIH